MTGETTAGWLPIVGKDQVGRCHCLDLVSASKTNALPNISKERK